MKVPLKELIKTPKELFSLVFKIDFNLKFEFITFFYIQICR